MAADFPLKRIVLATGVELDTVDEGPRDAPAILFLHGFPESHRTWRHQIARLSDRFRCIAPDQRGYARSSKPPAVEDYAVPKLVADVFALADALGIDRFILAAHDWGGAVGWAAALTNQQRIARLMICNAPHPYVFQRTLIEDLPQREASQYIRVFRDDTIDREIAEKGLGWFFDDRFRDHLASATATAEDRAAYLDEWSVPGAMTAMLNWYRASPMQVPAMDATERSAFLDRPFPRLHIPTLIVWGMKDVALLPCQLDGLEDHIDDVTIVRVPEAGHFVTWEAPEAVSRAMSDWLS